jgi:hypothetical protein
MQLGWTKYCWFPSRVGQYGNPVVRRHRSHTRLDFLIKKIASCFICLLNSQRYTYRLFLIIFGSWTLYEVHVHVRVLKVSGTLKNDFVAFAGKINLPILIGPKIKVLICSSYRSEWFRKKKECRWSNDIILYALLLSQIFWADRWFSWSLKRI